MAENQNPVPKKSDRVQFAPHSRFVSNLSAEQREHFRSMMVHPLVQSALVACIAEMSSVGYSREKMDGALAFVDLFTNFSENPKMPTQLPVKSLTTV